MSQFFSKPPNSNGDFKKTYEIRYGSSILPPRPGKTGKEEIIEAAVHTKEKLKESLPIRQYSQITDIATAIMQDLIEGNIIIQRSKELRSWLEFILGTVSAEKNENKPVTPPTVQVNVLNNLSEMIKHLETQQESPKPLPDTTIDIDSEALQKMAEAEPIRVDIKG